MKIPGTDLDLVVWRDGLHRRALEAGVWDNEPPTSQVLLSVIEHLSRAAVCYREDRILPTTFYRPTGPKTADGVIVYLGYALIRLMDLSGHLGVKPSLWNGIDRHHTVFYSDLHSIMGRVLRLKEDYPTEATVMIEKFVPTWMSRAEFWQLVLQLAEDSK